jgi:hypothetical protein
LLPCAPPSVMLYTYVPYGIVVCPSRVSLFHKVDSFRNEGVTVKAIETLLDRLVNTIELYLVIAYFSV